MHWWFCAGQIFIMIFNLTFILCGTSFRLHMIDNTLNLSIIFSIFTNIKLMSMITDLIPALAMLLQRPPSSLSQASSGPAIAHSVSSCAVASCAELEVVNRPTISTCES